MENCQKNRELETELKISPEDFEKNFRVKYIRKLEFTKFPIFKDAIKFSYHSPYRKSFQTEKELEVINWIRYKNQSLWKDDFSLKFISKKVGWGLFANRKIERCEFVGEYFGEVIQADTFYSSNYAFYYSLSSNKGSALFIESMNMGNHTRFMNHSANPNVAPCVIFYDDLLHQVFISTKTISPGEEITWNYGPLYWKGRNKPQDL